MIIKEFIRFDGLLIPKTMDALTSHKSCDMTSP